MKNKCDLLIILILALLPTAALGVSKYNIVIISVCSLNKKHLPLYGYGRMTTPVIDKFFKNSFIFDNAFTSLPWSNVTRYLQDLNNKTLAPLGYSILPGNDKIDNLLYLARDLDIKPNRDLFKKSLYNSKAKTFIAELHFKQNHYPYLDFLSPNDYPQKHPDYFHRNLNYAFLSAKDLAYLNDRLNSPQLTEADLPFLEIMFFNFQKYYKKQTGKKLSSNNIWLYSKSLIEKWKTSPGFLKDLEVMKNAYDGRIRLLDDHVALFLSLLNNKDFLSNTVFIFAGDHGQSLMEHDSLHAAETTYDEQITTPLMIKFPGMTRSERIFTQFSQGSIKKIINSIVKGELNKENFAQYISKNFSDDEYIYSINCSQTSRSVRYKNQWKLVHWSDTDAKELYDVISDPKEKTNVLKLHPKIAGQLEEKLLLHNFEEDLAIQTWNDRCGGT